MTVGKVVILSFIIREKTKRYQNYCLILNKVAPSNPIDFNGFRKGFQFV